MKNFYKIWIRKIWKQHENFFMYEIRSDLAMNMKNTYRFR